MAEVLIRRLLLLPDGGQLGLGEDVFRDGAFGAARSRAPAVVGPRVPQAMLWFFLLRGMSLGGKRLEITENMKDRLEKKTKPNVLCISYTLTASEGVCTF